MTKVANNSSSDESKNECTTHSGLISVNNRKSNYKAQKPILEKRRRDRINSSLDELKNILLAIKQRDPLRYARLEKADILEMVVKHLKDLKKKRQAMIATLEPTLFRNFKLGFMDCTRATLDFLNEIDVPEEKKKMILEHVNKANVKLFENKHSPPPIFTQHHERIFAHVNPPDRFLPFSFLTSTHTPSTDSEIEWPSFTERHNQIFSIDNKLRAMEMKPMTLLKIAEPSRMSAFNVVSKSSCVDLPSTSSSISATIDDETPSRLISHQIDISDDEDEENDAGKLIIDDPNNNTWRPWL